jgi:hypothetical protein
MICPVLTVIFGERTRFPRVASLGPLHAQPTGTRCAQAAGYERNRIRDQTIFSRILATDAAAARVNGADRGTFRHDVGGANGDV